MIKDPPARLIEPARANNPEKKDLRAEAEKWIEENPYLYSLFVRFAREKLERGKRFGIKALTERVRWEVSFAWGGAEYKINNNHHAYIARKLLEDIPELEGLLRFRQTKY